MRRIIDNDYLIAVLRLVVGIVFIYASVYKIADPGAFAKSIWYYHMIPGSLINLIAIILPWVELICGICLILGVWYDGSVILINLMTFVFIIALASAYYRGLDIDCGCFKASSGGGSSVLKSLLFDIVLLAFTIALLFSRSRKWRLEGK